MQDILNAYVKAAKAGKSFSEVAGLFEKDSSCKKENKEFYNDLKKQLGSGDGYITKEVKLDNYEGKYVIVYWMSRTNGAETKDIPAFRVQGA